MVNFKTTDVLPEALKMLNNTPDIIACDFETASKYKHKEIYTEPYIRNSNGLSYPALSITTHLSFAWSDKDAGVIIMANDRIRKAIYNWLVETDKLQLWHNACFDFRHIYYHTGKLPKKYIDTQLLAKVCLNDANNAKSDTGLKSLMAYAYGDWALAKDNFDVKNMYDETMLRYSATDACATYKLWEDITKDINANTI